MGEAETLFDAIERAGARTLDMRVADLAGAWRSVAIETSALDPAALARGVLIDGSAIPGWRDAENSDLRLIPDPSSARRDPFAAQETIVAIADAIDPATGDAYVRDPRAALRRALGALRRSGRADAARLGFGMGFYALDAASRSGAQSAFAPFPADRNADLRAEIAAILAEIGAPGVSHAQGDGLDQCDVYVPMDDLATSVDRIPFVKLAASGVAAQFGKRASFLAKPLEGAPPSILRLDIALDRDGQPVFAGAGYANLSDHCMYFMGGLIEHGRALSAFLRPETNSYRPARGGDEAPNWLGFAAFNRTAAIRVPFAENREDKRIELRFADPSANPYLAVAASLMAGLDGLERQIDPGDALDRNLYDLPAGELADTPRCPRSLDAALDALESDREFLMRDDVFSASLLDAYLALGRERSARIETIPHPAELHFEHPFA